jgi:hypothetical protein
MIDPFSVYDAFTVGVSFDLLGGYLLGRGLLASPAEIRQRAGTMWGSNPAVAIGQILARADATVGLASLGVGFVLQAGGYVILIGGATVEKGSTRAVVSVVLAVLVAAVWWKVLGYIRTEVVRRLVVLVARTNPATGELFPYPDGPTLMSLGHQLGFYGDLATEEPGPENPGPLDRYAQRYFGVPHAAYHQGEDDPTHIPEGEARPRPDC